MTRVLLTGASGFLGRPTLRALRTKGRDVHAVTSKSAGDGAGAGADDDVAWHRTDLLDGAAVDALCRDVAATHLIHLAWHSDHATIYQGSQNVAWADATVQLLHAFTAAGGRRAVCAGTCAEYDWAAGDDLSEDTSPLRPATPYGAAKLDAFRRITADARALDVAVAWARPFFVYGPGEPPNKLLSSVVRALLAGEEAACSHGRQIRDYVYVDDVAAALIALLASDIEGAVNVATGRGVALRQVVDEAARQLGRPDLIRFGARDAPPGEAARVVADMARLRDEVGFEAETSLEQGVGQTIDYWRSEIKAS